MSHGNIRQIPRSCVSYHPGHQVHWIHAKKAHEPQPEIVVVVTVLGDGHVELDGDDLHLSLWKVPRGCSRSLTRQVTMACGSPGSVRCSHRATADGYSISLPHLTRGRSPAYTAETALERAARHARERGMRGSVADTRYGGTACALPAVQPTMTPAPSVASISYELPSSGCSSPQLWRWPSRTAAMRADLFTAVSDWA